MDPVAQQAVSSSGILPTDNANIELTLVTRKTQHSGEYVVKRYTYRASRVSAALAP